MAVKKQELAITGYKNQLATTRAIPQPDTNDGVVFFESFEPDSGVNSGYDNSGWTTSGVGTIDPDSTTVTHTGYGSQVLKAVSSANVRYCAYDFAAPSWKADCCVRFYVYLNATPSANIGICQLRSASDDTVIRVRHMSTGNISLDMQDNSSTYRTYAVTTPGNGVWHMIELRFKYESGGVWVKFVKNVDGSPTTYENQFSGYTPVADNIDVLRLGVLTSGTYTYYFDDVAVRAGSGLTKDQAYLGSWTSHGLLTDSSDNTSWKLPCDSSVSAQFTLADATDTTGNSVLAVRNWFRAKQLSTTQWETIGGYTYSGATAANYYAGSQFMGSDSYRSVFSQKEKHVFDDPWVAFNWTGNNYSVNNFLLELSTYSTNSNSKNGGYISKAWTDVIYGDDNASGDIDSFLTHGPVFSAGEDEGSTASIRVWGRASGATSLVVRYGTAQSSVKAGYGDDTAITAAQAVTSAQNFCTPNSGIQLTGLTRQTKYYIDILVKQYNAGTPGTPDELRFTYDNEVGGNELAVGDACTWGSAGSGRVIYKSGGEMIVSCGRTSEVYEQISNDTWIKKAGSNSCQASANSTHWISTHWFEKDFSVNCWDTLPSFTSHLADGYGGQFNVSPSGDPHNYALYGPTWNSLGAENLQQFIMMGDEVELDDDHFDTNDELYGMFLRRRNWDAYNFYYWENILSKMEYARCISDHDVAENNANKCGQGHWEADFTGIQFAPTYKPVQFMRDTTSYPDLACADDLTGTADSSSTAKDSETGTVSSYVSVGYSSGYKWWATRFQASSSYTLKSVAYYMRRNSTGLPGLRMTAHIYSDYPSTPRPNVSLGASGQIKMNDLETTASWTSFGFTTGISITSGNYYWVVVETNGTNTVDFVEWAFSTTDSYICQDTDGSGTWNPASSTDKLLFKTFSDDVSLRLTDANTAERQVKYSSISGGTPVARCDNSGNWSQTGGDSVEWGSSWEYSGTLLFHDATDKIMIVLCGNSANPLTTSQNLRKAGGGSWQTSGTHDYVYNFPTVSRYGIYPGVMAVNIIGENAFGYGIVKRNFGTYLETYYPMTGGKYFDTGKTYNLKRAGLFYSFTQGNARFVVMDVRSRRDPNLTPNGDKFDGTSYPSASTDATACFSKDLTGAYDYNDYLTTQASTTTVLIKHSQADLTDKIVKWDMAAVWDSTDTTFKGFSLVKNITNANGGNGDIELEWEVPGLTSGDHVRFFESGASDHGWNLETNAEKDKANINHGHIQRTFVEQFLRDNSTGYWYFIVVETPFHSMEIVSDDKWGDYDTTTIMTQVESSGSWTSEGDYYYYAPTWYEKPGMIANTSGEGGAMYEVANKADVTNDEEWWWDATNYRVYVHSSKSTSILYKFYYSGISVDGVTPHANSVPFYDRCASRRFLKSKFGALNKICLGADRHFSSLHNDKTDADPWPYVLSGQLSSYLTARCTRKCRVSGLISHYHQQMGAWKDPASLANRMGGYALLEINQGGNYITRATIKERDGSEVQAYDDEGVDLSKAGDTVLGGLDDSYWLKYMTMDIDFFNTHYTRGSESSLPAGDTDLETYFTAPDYVEVSSPDDNIRVSQNIDDTYGIFLFKVKSNNDDNPINVFWEGQSSIAPTSSPVYLQIYNRNSTSWETLDSNNTYPANTDFNLFGLKEDNLNYYYDSSNEVACRVYQQNG